jgi:hypothetical protein
MYLERTRKPWQMQGDLKRKQHRSNLVDVREIDETAQTDEKEADGPGEGWSELGVVNRTGGHSREPKKTLLEGGVVQDSWTTQAQ